MAHAIRNDIRSVANDLAVYDRPVPAEPLSWRASAFVMATFSIAGWAGIALLLSHLFG